MSKRRRGGLHDRWARLRFSVIGPLLASPPARGELHAAFEALAGKTWIHPATEEPACFAVPTLERWFYAARSAGDDPVAALRKRVRSDAGAHPSLGPAVRTALRAQYDAHRTWSCQLHADNLEVVCEDNPELGTCPSYWTVRRYMKDTGLFKQRRSPNAKTPGAAIARERLENYEVRSYEATRVHGLWHSDFHDGSRRYEEFLSGDLIRQVEARYRVIPGREARGITGISMGGYGAWSLAAAKPDHWSALVPLAGGGEAEWAERFTRLLPEAWRRFTGERA